MRTSPLSVPMANWVPPSRMERQLGPPERAGRVASTNGARARTSTRHSRRSVPTTDRVRDKEFWPALELDFPKKCLVIGCHLPRVSRRGPPPALDSEARPTRAPVCSWLMRR